MDHEVIQQYFPRTQISPEGLIDALLSSQLSTRPGWYEVIQQEFPRTQISPDGLTQY